MFPKFDPVGESIKKCPFLRALVVTEGESFTRDVVENFSKTSATHEQTNPLEKLQNVATNFSLFHGENGILPLKNNTGAAVQKVPVVARSLPAASISLSGFWGDFNPFKSGLKKNKPEKPTRKNVSKARGHSHSVGTGAGTGGQCPMRKILGPLATAVMSHRYQCPKPIVMMRAALARSSAVRALRPESVEVKLLAVALASSMLNIPFGMLREHTKKFSPQWFLVVHATIPFIAMFRKAVVMPPYAIAFTIAAAIGGQAIGAKAEKRRIEWLASQDASQSEGVTEMNCAASEGWLATASLTTPRISA